ncbi:hypothetical protein SCLCIDRAFT_1206760 [Scleroderma citrinum Foug A]|uniref:Uncharacterized protein n=1 Tax=Scleroderma citrinum Foug A TaxID=1036808 RepID=A0A0C3ES67_9AGAM|nr:hypothetical protein SCLCIDRAFT_1206760 [Scleroderma citrinum Foug A]
MPPSYSLAQHPFKRRRRTATSVLAGDFDLRPARDVLTSLLNGVGPYKEVERDDELRRSRKREKEKERREREKERRRPSTSARALEKRPSVELATQPNPAPPTHYHSISVPPVHSSSFWRASATSHRPTINIATMQQRSVSVTPPPMASSPQSTPGPSTSSITSRTSSKRPRTPHDDAFDEDPTVATSPTTQPSRKKRVAVKKGWKGWVEGSPPPSEKLINLDAVPVLQERRTRSGKSFDAIGVGKETWV